MRRIYRDGLLVLTTAAACFAIATPLASSTSNQIAARSFTVWPKQEARFANMDWSCFYFGRDGNAAPQVSCGRESTLSGVRVTVDGQKVTVDRMSTAVDKRGFPKSYRRLLVAPRNP